MDIDMTDAGYDIDLDVDPSIEIQAPQSLLPVQDTGIQENAGDDAPMPAAYFESLEVLDAWPDVLNLQGVSDFGPDDPTKYALEHCPGLSVKRLRWVNDDSVNIEYYSPKDAADALHVLTDPQAGDPASLPAQNGRRAIAYARKPNSVLIIRESNSGDQKPKNAAVRSQFYKKNPRARERDIEREREVGRHRPQRDYLDYDGRDSSGPRRLSVSYHESMYDDNISSPNDVETNRDGRNGNRNRVERNREVDSYRPGARSSPRESRFGRLRDRSASPGNDGDGRLGFAEDGSSNRRHYRSRSRSRNDRRRRAPSNERWTHDRSAGLGNRDRGDSGGRWLKNSELPQQSRDTVFHKIDMGSNHRRMDAMDDTAKGSLLSRMTKDGVPVIAPRSLASRITRDDGGANYGRLKDDYSTPRDNEFEESAPKRDLASRITRDSGDDTFNIRGRSQSSGFNVRGTAVPQAPSFSIRGAAGGA